MTLLVIGNFKSLGSKSISYPYPIPEGTNTPDAWILKGAATDFEVLNDGSVMGFAASGSTGSYPNFTYYTRVVKYSSTGEIVWQKIATSNKPFQATVGVFNNSVVSYHSGYLTAWSTSGAYTGYIDQTVRAGTSSYGFIGTLLTSGERSCLPDVVYISGTDTTAIPTTWYEGFGLLSSSMTVGTRYLINSQQYLMLRGYTKNSQGGIYGLYSNVNTGEVSVIKYGTNKYYRLLTGLSANINRAILKVDADGNLWIVTDTKLIKLDSSGAVIFSKAISIKRIAIDNGYVYFMSNGLFVKADYSLNVVWSIQLSGIDVDRMAISGDFVYLSASTLIMKLPKDGSILGTYTVSTNTITLESGSYTEPADGGITSGAWIYPSSKTASVSNVYGTLSAATTSDQTRSITFL